MDPILVDSREPSVVYELVKKFAGARDVKIETLEIGDLMGSLFVAERKSVSDMVNSKLDGRLDRQLINLSIWAEERNMAPVLLVHGLVSDVANYAKGAHAIIPGIIASAATRYGMHVVWMPTMEEALRVWVKMDAKAAQEGRPVIKGRAPTTAGILSAYLGIPLKSAIEIEARGGLVWLVHASDAEILSIPGIGRKRLQRIRRLVSRVA